MASNTAASSAGPASPGWQAPPGRRDSAAEAKVTACMVRRSEPVSRRAVATHCLAASFSQGWVMGVKSTEDRFGRLPGRGAARSSARQSHTSLPVWVMPRNSSNFSAMTRQASRA